MRAPRKTAGFTLVEMMIVIAILGLLTAVALPQFTSQREEGKVGALVSNLAILRTAVDSYWSQHDSFPGKTNAAQLADQLLKNTSKAGAVGTGTGFGYGPYIRRNVMPTNPLTNTNTIKVVTVMPTAASGAEAWVYCNATGEVRCNVAGATQDGTPYFNL